MPGVCIRGKEECPQDEHACDSYVLQVLKKEGILRARIQ